jgi:hypothetical protein
MTAFKWATIIISLMILLAGCSKKDINLGDNPIDPNFTDLHDTLVYVDWANGYKYFNLDIDKDSNIDIIITALSYYSNTSGSKDYYQITPLNGYEVIYSDCTTTTWEWHPDLPDTIFYIDTVMIPRVFSLKDTIFSEDSYTQAPIMIKYGMSQGCITNEYHSGLEYGIGDIEGYFYFAFRNKSAINQKLAWLRLKFQHGVYPGIILNSCSYNSNENYFLIE